MSRKLRATPFPSPAASRFAAALAASALIHVSAPHFLSGGAARHAGVAQPRHPLSVRIVAEPERPQAQVLPEKRPGSRETPETAPVAVAPVHAQASRQSPPPPQVDAPRAAGALPDAPDLTYYPAKQLDVYPALSTALDLKYRGKAADEGVSGRALLLVLIDEIGAVKDVSVVEAEPASYFEEDAKRAFMAARFTPAYRNGRAVRSRVLIEVNYGVERGSP